VLAHLFYLWHVTKEPGILAQAERMIRKIIRNAKLSDYGVYWDRSRRQIRPLAGLSHGAIGIGTALLEASAALGADGLRWLAEEAASYDESLYDPETRNWPNYTLLVDDEFIGADLRKRYADDVLVQFFDGHDMVAWCHGATGVGLARLRYYERTGGEHHKAYALLALSKCRSDIEKKDDKRKFGLCHGAGATADLFLEAGRILNEPSYVRYASRVAAVMLAYPRQHDGAYLLELTHYNEDGLIDNSLFTGLAGIGYAYLRVYDRETPEVLLPWRVPGQMAGGSDEFNETAVRDAVVEGAFPRLHELIEQAASEELPRIADAAATRKPRPEAILGRAAQREESNTPIAERIDDVVALERRRVELDRTVTSNGLVAVEQDVAQMSAACVAADRAQVRRTAYRLSRWALRTSTRWPWPADDADRRRANLAEPPSETAMILIATPKGVRDMIISPATALILDCFSSPATPESVARQLIGSDDADFGQLVDLVIDQVVQAANAAILIPEPPAPSTTAQETP